MNYYRIVIQCESHWGDVWTDESTCKIEYITEIGNGDIIVYALDDKEARNEYEAGNFWSGKTFKMQWELMQMKIKAETSGDKQK